jgi:hypothetical protein
MAICAGPEPRSARQKQGSLMPEHFTTGILTKSMLPDSLFASSQVLNKSVSTRLNTVVTPLIDQQRFILKAAFPSQLFDVLHQQTEDLFSGIRAQITSYFPDLTRLRKTFPKNLLDADFDLNVDVLRLWTLDESLPVAWVPGPRIIKALSAATSRGERRSVYGTRWKTILNQCESALNNITASEVAPFVAHSKKAIMGLREGHTDLAQAYAASILDTAVTKLIPKGHYQSLVRTTDTDDLEELSVSQFLMFSQLNSVHTTYSAKRGDPVPRSFNRHATIHAVGFPQYSRINALLGIAHVTSFLCLQNIQLGGWKHGGTSSG